MENKPQLLHRYPNGVGVKTFFRKIYRKGSRRKLLIESCCESTGETVHYLICKNEHTLLLMANIDCIKIHLCHIRVKKPLTPDYCFIDLDLHKTNTFDEVVATTLKAKELMDEASINSYVKHRVQNITTISRYS